MWRNGSVQKNVAQFQGYSSERCGAMVIVRRDVAQWLEFREMWHNGYSSERCGAMVIVRRDVAQWLEFREMWHNG